MSAPPLRAPRENGQILAVPPLAEVGALLHQNEHFISSKDSGFHELRRQARREILAASNQYHQKAGQPVEAETSERWLVAGHQPDLFHPGVWFKNFALHALARRHGGMALNLVIDTDSAKPPWLHLPGDGRVVRIPFDRFSAELPYEEREVVDEAAFAELPKHVRPVIDRWDFEPMFASFWREVMWEAERTKLLGERFAAGRRRVERRWGLVQREVPMSRVCQTASFARFAVVLLERLPEFVAIYNETVRDYRVEHGIKSQSHPVPDLAADGEWLESPFWAWRHGQPKRGRLFVQATIGGWRLRVGDQEWPTLRGDLVSAWTAVEKQGFKIRSRALTTTMYARLFLADLFVHGVGGGIYDELTDRIIQRFFGMAAPAYLVMSATLLLPLPRYPDAVQRCRALQRQLRDVTYKPERFLTPGPTTEPLLRAKQSWIERPCSTHRDRVERYQQIRELSARLQPFVSSESQRVERELAECRRNAEWHEVAARRDYPFCLYPEDMLRQFFQSAMG